MFPGRDYMDQLHRIVDTLGTPSYEDTEYIASDKARAYIRSLPYKKKVNYRAMFPKAPDLALDLLEKMLTFAPEKRITVEQALAHPYLKLLHDPSDEPVCPTPFDVDFENITLGKEALRALLWEETCQLHPDLRLQTPPGLQIPDIKAEAAKHKRQQAESDRLNTHRTISHMCALAKHTHAHARVSLLSLCSSFASPSFSGRRLRMVVFSNSRRSMSWTCQTKYDAFATLTLYSPARSDPRALWITLCFFFSFSTASHPIHHLPTPTHVSIHPKRFDISEATHNRDRNFLLHTHSRIITPTTPNPNNPNHFLHTIFSNNNRERYIQPIPLPKRQERAFHGGQLNLLEIGRRRVTQRPQRKTRIISGRSNAIGSNLLSMYVYGYVIPPR